MGIEQPFISFSLNNNIFSSFITAGMRAYHAQRYRIYLPQREDSFTSVSHINLKFLQFRKRLWRAMYCAIALLLVFSCYYQLDYHISDSRGNGLVSNILFDREYTCSRSGSTDFLSTLHMLFGEFYNLLVFCQYFLVVGAALASSRPYSALHLHSMLAE